MKTSCLKRRSHGLTLLEALFVTFLLFMLASVLLPAIVIRKSPAYRIRCVNNLKQTGIAFLIWQGDHNGKFPMELSVTNGGVMELAAGGNAAAVFQIMSNELSVPKLLVCPADQTRHAATNFNLTPKNIDYFVGLDAHTNRLKSLLSGDDNFELGGRAVGHGLKSITTNAMCFWSITRHNRSGNIGLADGSVQMLTNSNLVNQIGQTGLATNRLVIP